MRARHDGRGNTENRIIVSSCSNVAIGDRPAMAQDGQIDRHSVDRHTGIDMYVSPRNSRFIWPMSHPISLTFHTGSPSHETTGSPRLHGLSRHGRGRKSRSERYSCIDQHRRLPYRANSIDCIGSSKTACLTLFPLFAHYTVGSRQLVRSVDSCTHCNP